MTSRPTCFKGKNLRLAFRLNLHSTLINLILHIFLLFSCTIVTLDAFFHHLIFSGIYHLTCKMRWPSSQLRLIFSNGRIRIFDKNDANKIILIKDCEPTHENFFYLIDTITHLNSKPFAAKFNQVNKAKKRAPPQRETGVNQR
jgi:hypothetical protein